MKLLDFFTVSKCRRYSAACLLGVGLTFAFPPLYIIPFLFIGLSGLLFLIHISPSAKQAFWVGWWFGFGHFVTGIYWIAYALLTDAAQFGWMVPFAVFGISAALAVYVALVSAATRVAPLKSPISLVIVFSLLWVVGEYARAYLFSGFPWNLIGYVWTYSDAMIQPASVIGIYGLGLISVLAGASLFLLMINPGRWQYIILPAVCSSLLVAGWVWGNHRLAHAAVDHVEGVTLRIVQGNIKQELKWEQGQKELNLQKYVDLTKSDGFDRLTYVIWPETALPYIMKEYNPGMQEFLRYVAPPNGALLTGAMRLEESDNDYEVWNSFFVLTRDAGVYAHSDKFHLVPFGEYVPLRSWMPGFISKITQGTKDFSTGTGPEAIALPTGEAVLPLICYEGIFPQYVNGNTKGEYDWILNITNDAWFGVSSGPYQHLNMTRMRAVEHGVPLVRAANTGVSAVIDPYGRIISEIPLNKTAVLDSNLPKKLKENTLYSGYGMVIVLFIMVLCLFGAVLIEYFIKI